MSATTEKDEFTGLEKVVLRNRSGETVEIYRHGGHIVSWKSAQQQDLLFTSSKAIYSPPKAIRGGVPICFPQFGMLGPLGQHGFVRNSMWQVAELHDSSVILEFEPDAEQLKMFPYPFKLQTKVVLGTNVLTQELTAYNAGQESFQFTAALHTYYKVADVAHVSVTGLKDLKYMDNLEARAEKVDEGAKITFSQEVDRIYLNAPNTITVTDTSSMTRFVIHKSGFPDAVVWNPWVDKAKAMADFGDEEYKVMLCIEPAVAGSGVHTLAPGETWTGVQQINHIRLD